MKASMGKIVFLFFVLMLCVAATGYAEEENPQSVGLNVSMSKIDTPQELSQSIQILLVITMLSLAPSAIIMMTSFTRIMIVLGFLRRALGTQQSPPAQIMAGMALFLTIFIMAPVWHKINTDAIQPYLAEQITQKEAWQKGIEPIRVFMERQTGEAELSLFVEISESEKEHEDDPIPLEVLIPAFMVSELKVAFQLGFLVYVPFLVIDLVIASSLMSMGMMMLPPMMISLPIKVLFFILADGWNLTIRSIVTSFTL